ncbi:MAG TPA: biosynthetic-type acetolactate synthase large subunit [Chloroflexota bacterium]|nr:biosynthetic-type acetolactate synthase large subunit [Chloroflexota bacterium]
MAVAMRDAPLAPSHARRPDGVRMSGSHIVFESLIKEGVDLVFGLPGGAILPLYHVMPEYQDRIRHVLVRHEQGAAHAADGYARATGRPGVCIATSGPGATNLVTGIATAMLDSSPLVAITGNVATHMIGKDAFQETDITGVTLPITKHNWLVMRPEDIAPTFKEAFHLATTGRPGPVLVDIPKDVQQQLAVFEYPKTLQLRGYKPTVFGNIRQIRQAVKAIQEAKNPVILAGHGIVISEAYDELRQLAELGDLPVMQTLLGLSTLPESHPLCFGFFGMHGSVYANRAVNQTDLVVAIGMRFDDRACGKFSAFAPHAKIVHIDIDPAEIGKNVRCDIPIVGDVKNVLMVLNKELQGTGGAQHRDWVQSIQTWKRDRPGIKVRESEKLLPQYVLNKLSEATKGQAIVVCDVGQHQMWAAQHIKYEARNTHISSGGLGTMGFGFPAAVGVKMGRPDEEVWAVVGDGGFQMTLQELATAVQEHVSVKVAIINNGFLGMVRQWQELFHDNRYSSVAMSNPDFVMLAEAYGVKGLRCVHKSDVEATIQAARDHDGPVVIDFVVESEENVYPIIPSGATAHDLIEEPDLLEQVEEAHITALEGEAPELVGAGARNSGLGTPPAELGTRNSSSTRNAELGTRNSSNGRR